MPDSYLPKIEKPKVDRRRLPSFLNAQEVRRMALELEGEAALAFCLIRYTDVRRRKIARKFVGDGRGLKWKDIDKSLESHAVFQRITLGDCAFVSAGG